MNAWNSGRLPAVLLATVLLASCASTSENAPANAGARTLAQAEVDALLLGKGLGMAAVAEINGYPGPQHVLALKDELDLTPDQRFATSRLLGLMQGQARALGQRIIDAERRLDADMAEGVPGRDQVRARLESIAALRAQLRFTHIDAHLQQRDILNPEQVRRYYELRGREVDVPAPVMPPEPTEALVLPAEATPAASPAPPAGETGKPAASSLPAPPAPAASAKPLPPRTQAMPPDDATPASPATETRELTPGQQDALEEAETAPVTIRALPVDENEPANDGRDGN